MKITQEQRYYIKYCFARIKTKNDFLVLLNYVKEIIYGVKAVPFDEKQLNYHINSSTGRIGYRVFAIKKKSGGERLIYAPNKGLKEIQSCLNIVLQQMTELPDEVTGFVLGKSIIDNAKIHVGKMYIYNLDLKDFFPSIDIARFWGRLKNSPFNLNEQTGRLEIANIICALTGHNMIVQRRNNFGELMSLKKNVLPQGAPTSPVISNIICETLDRRLKGVAKKFGAQYSRYADDITFSSMHSLYAKQGPFVKEIERIIKDQNFEIKESKTRLLSVNTSQTVTGLVVNKKVNVSRRYIEQIRRWLHYLNTRSYEEARFQILQQYDNEKACGARKKNIDFINVISGKLEYLRMIRGDEDKIYQKLYSKFIMLSTKGNSIKVIETESKRNLNLEQLILDFKTKYDLLNQLSIPNVHSPKRLVDMLKKFSLNDQALKYTTHTWDSDLFHDLNTFLQLIELQYKSFSFDLKELSKNLNGKIYGFLFNKEIGQTGWGTYRIRFGWSSPELIQATMENPNLNPEDFILPLKYQMRIEGRTIQKFKHVIDLFKNEIEIRDENSALYNLILEKHDKYLIDFKLPDIDHLRNKTFYTDVQWLDKALDLIFENIGIRTDSKVVSYDLNEDFLDKYVLKITHIGSFNFGKSFTDDKFLPTSGSFGDINRYLMNLCDWSVESIFLEGTFRINYLVSESNIPVIEKIEKVQGFTHILTFYKR